MCLKNIRMKGSEYDQNVTHNIALVIFLYLHL